MFTFLARNHSIYCVYVGLHHWVRLLRISFLAAVGSSEDIIKVLGVLDVSVIGKCIMVLAGVNQLIAADISAFR